MASMHEDESTPVADALGLLLGGPMAWACRMSQYFRPPVDEDEEDEEGRPLWRVVRDMELDVDAYLERIGTSRSEVGRRDRATLDLLIRRHLDHVPFENLDVINGVRVDLDARRVYEKIVERRRGGFCFEVNLVFGWLLLKLGFDARYGLARVWRPSDETRPLLSDAVDAGSVLGPQTAAWGAAQPPSHVLIHVRFPDGRAVLADVGFGEPPRGSVVVGAPYDDGVYSFRTSSRGGLTCLERRSLGAPGLGGIVSTPGAWEPRVLFDVRTARSAAAFAPGLALVQDPSAMTIFTRAPFLQRLRDDGAKVALTNGRLKVTKGPLDLEPPTPVRTHLERAAALEAHFRVRPLDAHADAYVRAFS